MFGPKCAPSSVAWLVGIYVYMPSQTNPPPQNAWKMPWPKIYRLPLFVKRKLARHLISLIWNPQLGRGLCVSASRHAYVVLALTDQASAAPKVCCARKPHLSLLVRHETFPSLMLQSGGIYISRICLLPPYDEDGMKIFLHLFICRYFSR